MFCPKCGANAKNANFCPSCGNSLTTTSRVNSSTQQTGNTFEEVILWKGKPSGIADKAKAQLNGADYKITNQRIIIKTGLIGKKENEIDFRN